MTLVKQARAANSEVCTLGEGPIWDGLRNRLLWVDIRRGLVFSGTLTPSGDVEILDRVDFGQTVGAVAVAPSGEWLIAGATALLRRTTEGQLSTGADIIPPTAGRRLNDGKADPQGSFVVGSLSLVGPSDVEVLIRAENDGTFSTLDSDLTLSNGLAWSGDGRTLYSVDTMRQVIFSRSYDRTSGAVGPREVFVTVEEGYPDGICLDAEDHLWVAMWGLGEVHRYSPEGQLDQVVEVPAPHVSSVTFAGPLLDTLVITTATQDLSDEQLEKYPDSGRLFTFDAGVLGMPMHLWNGSFTANNEQEQR